MPRLIVLILPILLLWLAFKVGSEPGTEEVENVLSSGRHTENPQPESRSFSLESSSPGQPPQRPLLSPQRLQEKLRDERRAESVQGPALEKKGRIVDEILAEIRPALLARLTAKDHALLRSYVTDLTSPEAGDQPWLCWGENVSKEKAAAFHEVEKLTGMVGSEFALFANQFFRSGRWERTATDGGSVGTQGQPVTVTWSIVPDGTSAPGSTGQVNAPSDFRTWIASIYGGSTTGPAVEQPWFPLFKDSLDAMAATCGVTLRYESNDDGATMDRFTRGELGVRGDIRISARAIDGNSGTLAFAYGPDHGDMVFDSSDNVFQNTSSSSVLLFNTIGHELGHSLGLAHVCPVNETKLLEPILTRNFRGPRFDEHQSLQRLYGDRLEVDGPVKDNDSVNNATLVILTEDETLQYKRLSIDDNTDRDYFRIQALRRQKLTVAVRPGEGTYLEGGGTIDGCSQGVNFDSNAIHNLRLEVIDPDGVTVLATSDFQAEGEVEKIDRFEIEKDGLYFVKISGDTSNAAQLYRVDFRLGDRDPEAALEERESLVLAESGSVKNGRLDANETVKLAIEIVNDGVLSTGPLTVTVVGSSNVSIFSSEIAPAIDGDEMGLVEVVYGALGECGDFATLNFEIADDSGVLLTFEKMIRLGEVLRPVVMEQKFDGSSDLPADWTSVESGAGVAWDPVSSRFASALRSAFSAGVASISEAWLISPSLELTSDGGTLSFEHLYRTEVGFDGAVLEASRNDGAWFDVIEDPLTVVTGGYNRTIRTDFDSAIAGRRAWSANLTEFVLTTVKFPSEWAGETVRLRWRLVHDGSSSSDGWWVDNVKFELAIDNCEFHRPALNLELENGSLDENDPSQNAVLILSSELPLVESLAVTLESSGSANGDDFLGGLEVTLAAGQQSVAIPLTAASDDLAEGDETLILTIPADQPGFAPGGKVSETLTITDLFGINQWVFGFFGESVPLSGDSDGDGLSELAEYLLGTDPTLRASRKEISLQASAEGFLIPLMELPSRPDATLGLEISSNLINWIPGAFETAEEGLMISSQAGQNFLRLTFSLDQ